MRVGRSCTCGATWRPPSPTSTPASRWTRPRLTASSSAARFTWRWATGRTVVVPLPPTGRPRGGRPLTRCVRGERRASTGALADFKKAEEIDPNNSDVYYHRGQVRLSAADLSGHGPDPRPPAHLFAHGPGLFSNRNRLGVAVRQVDFLNGKLADAISDYRKSMSLNNDVPFGPCRALLASADCRATPR